MKHSLHWIQNRPEAPDAAQLFTELDLRRRYDPSEFTDGRCLYRVTASDGLTWLDLCVRVKPGPGLVPVAHDISLHTAFPRDPQGDRWLDYTSSLMGQRFVGHIVELLDPHPSLWSELDKHFLEYDDKARNAYARVIWPATPARGDEVAAAWKAGAPIELVSVYRVVGRNDNVVLIEATDMFAAISKYRDHVDRTVAKFAVLGAIKPVYDINMIELLDAVTIIR